VAFVRHPLEIESLGLSPDLREMLVQFQGREGVTYVSNGGLIRPRRTGRETQNGPVDKR